MVVVMRRYGIGCRGELHLYGSLRHHLVALLQSAQDFHPFAVTLAKGHFLLAVAFLVHLYLYVVHALLLG